MAAYSNPTKPGGATPEVKRLMAAVIQMPDYEIAARALSDAGFYVTQLGSSGGFLGRQNLTLLIGIQSEQESVAEEILRKNCRRRVEYITTSLEGAPFHMPLPTPISVGGATVFTLTVERFEEIY